MKAACPRCGRRTEIDDEAGDFPVRCNKCGALLRQNRKRNDNVEPESGAPEVRRIERGTLAGLLVTRASSQESAPTIIRARPGGTAAAMAAPSPETDRSILQPESRKEIARTAARHKALHKATLRAKEQSFSALSWAGLTLIALLLIGVVVLKAQAIWQHPAPARADTLRINP